MNTLNKKELIIGLAMLGASLAYLVLAQQLPGHDGVDAATVPKLLAGLLSLLGVMQLISAFAKPKAAAESASPVPTEAEEQPADVIEPKTVLKTLGLILGYMALLGPVGFPIMTVVYLYLQFLVLTPVNQKARHLTYLLIAVICSALIFLLFREAFDLMLPAGLLNNFI
ncbi:tripartite tricarboxylate transporter TctB family protein [Ectopseudomonas toyotomiensis]|uniref:Tripartite tricarboxylate transporter TctB family protein n=1 Tax=Ectopseudomonas toyotomiensis TaxID=554344 RepID=A0A1I5MYA3_9GAMM|nr:tripartite tricarboxylate transporter TctB family protein [Pseudomonas toyotomiensis]PIA74954.1 tripartite tricarboxylate transporter TctB family protein [Pseudomonas toyotomiensis]QSL91376.1 tripartite tricarboxylate transporter TctB family protein [Pseudomonas toyotomiensis]SFP14524.1 Tripartite tricarboxylate transporter TctB family protein [Pseudomonas toyotomiensis]